MSLSNGWYQAQNDGLITPSNVPWQFFDTVYHFAAKPTSVGGIDAFGPNGYLTTAEIAAFKSRPAGKKLLCTLKDADDQSIFGRVTTPGMISTFVTNIVNFINTYGYDGIDIDWEAQVNPTQYNDLINRLRTSLGANRILTMDAGDWSGLPDVALASYSKLDCINVMCYDMDNMMTITWFNSCVHAVSSGQRACDTRMGKFSPSIPSSKLILGVPFYGRKWTGTSGLLQPGTNLGNGIPLRKLVKDPNYNVSYMQYDGGYMGAYLAVNQIPPSFYSYMSAQQMKDAGAWAANKEYGGMACFCLTDDDLASGFPLSAAQRLATGGSVVIPPNPTPSPLPMTITTVTKVASDGTVTVTHSETHP